MLALSLIWLALGALLGLLAVAARLTPPRWERRRWLALPALGALVALAGGWLGGLLLDHLFASFVAIWLSVAVVGAVGLLARRQRVA
jgi:uncharacterized membrane protein YeaQ/YmgE (transglycosylase-associated protein family)